MSEPWQLFFHANLMVIPGSSVAIIFIHEIPSRNRKSSQGVYYFIQIIAKDYFSFPAFNKCW